MTAQLEVVEEPQILLSVLIFLICFVGVIGNSCTLLIIKKNLAFRDVDQARLFLANLAVVDLLNSLIAIFHGLGFINKDIFAAQSVCSLAGYADMFLRSLAVFSLTLLTANRFYTTTKSSVEGHSFDSYSSWLYVIAIWVFALWSCIIFAASDPQHAVMYDPGLGACSFRNVDIRLPLLVFFSLMRYGSMFCICYFNFKIWLHITRKNRQISEQHVISQQLAIERNNKVTKIVAVIFVLYVIFNVPSAAVSALRGRGIKIFWLRLAVAFFNINFVNNMFVYGIMDKNYRKSFKKLFCKCNN